MNPKFNAKFIEDSLRKTDWDRGNEVLYKLCADSPGHRDNGVIIAKIWLIGRAYSATIERRLKAFVSKTGDSFYEKQVAPKILKSLIDDWLRKLTDDKANNPELSIEVHKNLTGLFHKISGMEKRSLASKYLHFHFRDRYFIYDSYANAALASVAGKHKRQKKVKQPASKYDAEYEKFFRGCLELNQHIKGLIGRELNPREMDKCLLAWNRKNKKPKKSLS